MSSGAGAPERHVASACPLDCPDACSLDVTVAEGRVVAIGGSRVNPVTHGYICAKVREFPRHMYGEARLLQPGLRDGPKGEGRFRAVSWDEALALVSQQAPRGPEPQRGRGDPAVLLRRLERLPLAGHDGRAALPPARRVAAGAHGLRRAFGRGQRRSLRQDDRNRVSGLRGRAPHRALGREPVRFRDPSRPVHPGGAEEGRPARGRGSAPDAPRRARGPPSRSPPRDGPAARSGGHPVDLRGGPGGSRVSRGACHRRRRSSSAGPPTWTLERAAAETRIPAADIEPSRACTRTRARPRCAAAGGRSGTATAARRRPRSWRFPPWPESSACGAAATRCPTPRPGGTSTARLRRPPTSRPRASINMNLLGDALAVRGPGGIEALFVYDCNPLMTIPAQEKVRAGLGARGSLHRRVRPRADGHGALRGRRAARRDVSRAAGDLARLRRPRAPGRPGRRRAGRRGAVEPGCLRRAVPPDGRGADRRSRVRRRARVGAAGLFAPAVRALRQALDRGEAPAPAEGARPVQFVDAFPRTVRPQSPSLAGGARSRGPGRALCLPAGPGDGAVSRWPSFRRRPTARSARRSASCTGAPVPLELHPDDAAARGIADGAPVRVYNALGEVRCRARLNPGIKDGRRPPAQGHLVAQHRQRHDRHRPRRPTR